MGKVSRQELSSALVTELDNDASNITQLLSATPNLSNHSMARQAIRNGNFELWQRGTTITNPANSAYTSDGWKLLTSADSGVFPSNIIHSKQILTAGELDKSYYFYRINVDGAGSGLGANSVYAVFQFIEQGVRYLCGLNRKVTVSFYARSSISNKKIGVYIYQNYGTGGSPTAQETINGTKFTLTSNWTKYSFTFTTNTLVGKTFGTANDDRLTVVFPVMYGSSVASRVGDTVAETFVGSGNIDIAQIQLCSGDMVLPFQPKDIEETWSKSLRYTLIPQGNSIFARMISYTANTMTFFIPTPSNMRIAPTIIGSADTDIIVYNTALAAQTGFTFTAPLTNGGVIITATKTAHGLTDGCLEIKTTSGFTAEL